MTKISPNKTPPDNAPFKGSIVKSDENGKTKLTGTLIHEGRTYKVTVRYNSESLSKQYGEQDLDERVSALVNALKDQMESIAGHTINVSLNKPGSVKVIGAPTNLPNLNKIKEIFKKGLPLSKPKLLMTSPIDPVGIQNVGGSCYMNSSLQALFSSERFLRSVVHFLEDWDIAADTDEDRAKKEVIFRLVGLMNSLHANKEDKSSKDNIERRARALKDSFFLTIFKSENKSAQQDAPELVTGILDILNLKFNTITTTTGLGDADIKEDVHGIYLINIIKGKESLQENLDEAFKSKEETDTKIEMKKSVEVESDKLDSTVVKKLRDGIPKEKVAAAKTLFAQNATLVKVDGFEAFKFKDENDSEFYVFWHDINFVGEDKISYIKSSYKKTVTKWSTKEEIKGKPGFLVMQLQRNSNNKEEKKSKKINTKVHIDDEVKVNGASYRITGIVSHQGESTTTGHYIAHVQKDGKWTKCNDNSLIETKDFNDLANRSFFNPLPFTPYLFVLERIDD